MRLYKKGIVASRQLLGPGKNFIFVIFVVFLFMLLSVFTFITFWLDNIFFRGYRKVEIKKPVFIIGHPRSGTTFIHHLFTGTDQMAAFKAWHVLFPAITGRAIVKPLIRFLTRKGLGVLIPAETGHQIALDKVEEEEMLFLHIHDTQFITIGTPMGFLEDDFRELRFHDLQPRSRRIRSVQFLKGCFQRQIYYTGKTRIFAQTHFSTHRIKTLLEVFPDARFIYMHRMPEETLPSYFSLNYNADDVIWGMHRFSSEQIQTFFNYRYAASLELYRYFYDLWHNNEIDKEKVLIVPYDTLRTDLMATFEKIIAHTGIEPSPALRRAVERQVEKQKNYQRAHKVHTLAEFGIDESRVKKDFAFLYTKDPFGVGLF